MRKAGMIGEGEMCRRLDSTPDKRACRQRICRCKMRILTGVEL